MSRIAFFNVPAVGHTNPTLKVVEELIERGHEILYFSFDMVQEAIEETGATFVSSDEYMTVETSEVEDMLVEDLAGLAEMAIDTTLNFKEKAYRELEVFQPDCIVYDSLWIWGQLYAKNLEIPYVCSTTTLAFNRECVKEMSPSFNELSQVVTGLPSISRKMKNLEEEGFEVNSIRDFIDLILNDNDTPTVVYTSREFQPVSDSFSDKFHFVGPVFDLPEQEPKESSLPLVYIALGSMLNDKEEFYRQCIAGLEELDVEVVMAVGSDTHIASLGQIPEGIQVAERVDQLALLEQAHVFLTHAGMNSISESLYFGVPSVLAPIHSEEEMIAERVQEVGAGAPLKVKDAEGIQEAVSGILNNPLYIENAEKIGRTFKEAGGSEAAADVIGQVISNQSQ